MTSTYEREIQFFSIDDYDVIELNKYLIHSAINHNIVMESQ